MMFEHNIRKPGILEIFLVNAGMAIATVTVVWWLVS